MRHTQPFPFVRADFIGPEGNSPVELSNSLNQHRPANLRHSGGFDNDTKDMRMRNGLNGLVSSNSRICFAVITQKSIGGDPVTVQGGLSVVRLDTSPILRKRLFSAVVQYTVI